MGKIEVALTTENFLNQKNNKMILYRPKGSIISAINESRLRMAWVTRIGYHASPAYRYKYPEPKPVYFQSLIGLWQKSWYDIFKAADNKETDWITAWNDISKSGAVIATCGLDFHKNLPLVDTWCWSKKELKRYAVIDIDDETVPEGEELCGPVEENYDGTVITTSKYQINYKDDIGISGETLVSIEDKKVKFYPRHNYKVNYDKIKSVTYKKALNIQIKEGG